MVKISRPPRPKCATPRSDKGACERPNSDQLIVPRDVKTKTNAIIAIITVPIISTFGMTLRASFVSPARNVVVSQPKNVSEMKKIAIKIADVGKTKKGVKLDMLIFIKPGIIRVNNVTKVITANATSIVALVFIPRYAI